MTDLITQEFIRDFLEESAEHLLNIRQNLLALEGALGVTSAPVEKAVERVALVNELFRSFHTLKGLAGMVGLAQAEELSHAMESVLRAIQQMQIEVRPEVIDRLFQGTQTLEQIIDALNNPGEPITGIQRELKLLAALLPTEVLYKPDSKRHADDPLPRSDPLPSGLEGIPRINGGALQEPLEIPIPEINASLSALEQQQLAAAQASGRSLALAIFTPDAQKAEMGVNVTTVRQQFSQAGELIKSVPLVQGAVIHFAFLIASPAPLDPGDFPEMDWIPLSSRSPVQDLPAGDGGKSAPPEHQPFETPDPASPVPQPSPYFTPQSGAEPGAASTLVRVELERLDELMRLVSDLVVTRYRLAETLPKLQGAPAPAVEEIQQTVGKMERQLRDLRRSVLRTRMVPLSEVFNHMPLAVRELARASGKELRLVMEGENTEIDKVLVERLLDPLLHLVRNAIIHGLETPAERAAAGKNSQGTLTLRGIPEGDHILVSVSDDGGGIDTEKVIAQAVSLGLLEAERANDGSQAFSPGEIMDLISMPGFSTKGEADLGAGRGVGLDVVARMVSSFGGSLNLNTVPERGTTFTLRLPLTLTIVEALIIRCGSERYAVPQSAVDRVIEIDPAQIVRVQSGEIYPYQQDSLTLLRLADLFHLPGSRPGPYLYGLVSNEGEGRTALVVDQLIGLREVVVRIINDPLVALPGIGGATELGDGRVMLILNLPSLIRRM